MKILFALFLSCLVTAAKPQTGVEATLWGESGDGKTVKLIWFLKTWDARIRGFDIKRRTGGGEWITLNSSLIVPELQTGKNLANVEPDIGEQQRLKTLLQSSINAGRIKPVPAAAYLQRLAGDDKALQAVAITIALDYDLALLHGFALVDRGISAGNNYEYGLFLNGPDSKEPSAVFSWRAGTKAIPAIPVEIGVRRTAVPNQVQLWWKAEAGRMQAVHPAGFNVYKQQGSEWKKINKGPVAIGKEASLFSFFDSDASRDRVTRYAVAIITLFSNEGPKTEYTYDPARYPSAYRAAEPGEPGPAGENFKNGIAVNWQFPVDDEKYIAGFRIEKAVPPGDYEQPSVLMPASSRNYTDAAVAAPGSYIKYRIKTIYNDSSVYNSSEQLYYYLPHIRVAAPGSLHASVVKDANKRFVELSWAASSDTLVRGYRIYAGNSTVSNGRIYQEAGIPLITGHTYRYEVKNNRAADYRFIVAAVSRFNVEGYASDTVAIGVPGSRLPAPVVQAGIPDSNIVVLRWAYPDIPDLKGFRIYQNGNMVGNEQQYKKGTVSFVTPPLRYGATYRFTVTAVSESGVVSEPSLSREIFIAEKPGKNE